MRIAFRTDAALDIGTGHVMRCLALADELRSGGADCEFVCRTHPGHLIDLIRSRGHAVSELPVCDDAPGLRNDADHDYTRWVGASLAADADQTRASLCGKADWLVVDHYGLDAHWEEQLQAACGRLLVIDDLANRRHSCDVLLDSTLGRAASDYSTWVPHRCRLLLGPAYALLRHEFAELRESSLERRATSIPRSLLVMMGGVDKDNVTERILRALESCPLPPDTRVTVVLGQRSPWIARVGKEMASLRHPAELIVNPPSVAALLAQCDVAIGAAGTSAWERCCLGVPSIVVVLAENQRDGAAALQACGAALLLDGQLPLETDLPAKLRDLLSGDGLRQMQRACRAVTDGRGVLRVVEELQHETCR